MWRWKLRNSLDELNNEIKKIELDNKKTRISIEFLMNSCMKAFLLIFKGVLLIITIPILIILLVLLILLFFILGCVDDL